MKIRSHYNEQTELLKSEATLPIAELKTKATLGQGVLAPVREDLLNRVDFDSKANQRSRSETQRQSRSKEPIRDATSEQSVRAATKKPAIRGSTRK
jgi:hypothetical protein